MDMISIWSHAPSPELHRPKKQAWQECPLGECECIAEVACAAALPHYVVGCVGHRTYQRMCNRNRAMLAFARLSGGKDQGEK